METAQSRIMEIVDEAHKDGGMTPAGLFESFAYPLVIMFTVPFAMVGGFAGLQKRAGGVAHFRSFNEETKTSGKLRFPLYVYVITVNRRCGKQ